jgi:hypothetical protein
VRDVDDDAIGAGPFHLEIAVGAGRHLHVEIVFRGQLPAIGFFELVGGGVEVFDLKAEMVDPVEIRPVRADIGVLFGLVVQDREIDVAEGTS